MSAVNAAVMMVLHICTLSNNPRINGKPRRVIILIPLHYPPYKGYGKNAYNYYKCYSEHYIEHIKTQAEHFPLLLTGRFYQEKKTLSTSIIFSLRVEKLKTL